MKKFICFIACIIIGIVAATGIAACKKKDDGIPKDAYSVYAPDGAPALSIVSLCKGNDTFVANVVKADTITAYVTGENPKADFALLPVNAAVKILGNGERYKLLGTVTHGNLFLLKKPGGEEITLSNLSHLKGKTVGVINLSNVPGLTFKVILKDNGIEYNELKEGASVEGDKVNLLNVAANAVLPNSADCDYFVVPEPAASTKINATGGKLSLAASLQTLYGGEDGYPQAVAVVKNSVVEKSPSAARLFIESFMESRSMLLLEDCSADDIVGYVQRASGRDIAPTFTAENLSGQVIKNCGIAFVNAADSKQDIMMFMQKLNAVSSESWGTPQDKFFY